MSVPPIIKRSRVQVDPAPARGLGAPHTAGAAGAHGEKRVRLLEHDGRVRAIELVCACGETSVIELDYPDDPPPQEVPA